MQKWPRHPKALNRVTFSVPKGPSTCFATWDTWVTEEDGEFGWIKDVFEHTDPFLGIWFTIDGQDTCVFWHIHLDRIEICGSEGSFVPQVCKHVSGGTISYHCSKLENCETLAFLEHSIQKFAQMCAILELCYKSIMCCCGFMDRGLKTRKLSFWHSPPRTACWRGFSPCMVRHAAPSLSSRAQLLVHPMRKHTTINP